LIIGRTQKPLSLKSFVQILSGKPLNPADNCFSSRSLMKIKNQKRKKERNNRWMKRFAK
jgi:hypothetical protein